MKNDTMPKLESFEETEPEAPAAMSRKDEAFIMSADGARELSFGGSDGGPVSLQAFDTHRQIAAQKLGMEFFNMGEEAFAEFRERETYNGIFLDAVLVVYLCVNPTSLSLKALRASDTVRKMAINWAEKNGIKVGTARHGELIEQYGNILNDIIESITEVDETGTTPGGESLGESSETLPSM